MIYAIIAAGEGSRLREEGVSVSKPLIEINGKPLIVRLIDIFTQNHASAIYIIINDQMADVNRFFASYSSSVPLHLIAKSTPGSLHSFYALSKKLPHEKFCLTTVDTIFRESEFAEMITYFEKDCCHDGVFAVTDFVDDEKPLYVQTNDDLLITGFFDNAKNCNFVSGGIYCFSPEILEYLDECMDKNIVRMRQFQRFLLEKKAALKAVPFSKIIDIDHAADIEKANQFVQLQ